MRFALFAALLCLATGCVDPATNPPRESLARRAQQAEKATWQGFPGSPLREQHAMAYDEQRHRHVVFGGLGSSPSTLEYDMIMGWLDVAPSAEPPPRYRAAAAYHASLGRVILFGGLSAADDAPLGDLWSYDGASWTEIPVSGGPEPRGAHVMVYDRDRDRLLVHGGFGAGKALDNAWEWDGSTWTEITAAGPSARSDAGAYYDEARKRAVIVGGQGLAEVWSWDGATWSQEPPLPLALGSFALAYDSSRGRAVLQGGDSNGLPAGEAYDYDGVTWSPLSGLGPPPTRRHAASYDRLNQRFVMFGGRAGMDEYASSLWQLSFSDGTCASSDQCPSGFCVDGVCCDTACQGQCEACNLPDLVGICVAVVGPPAGERAPCPGEADVCGAQCDGVDRLACVFAPVTTTCGASICEGSQYVFPYCDGQGQCVSSIQSCGAYGCNAGGCLTSCTTDAECATGQRCVPGGQCVPAGVGYCDGSTNTYLSPEGASQACAPYACGSSGCLTTCSSDAECRGGQCKRGRCRVAGEARPKAELDEEGCSAPAAPPSRQGPGWLGLALGLGALRLRRGRR